MASTDSRPKKNAATASAPVPGVGQDLAGVQVNSSSGGKRKYKERGSAASSAATGSVSKPKTPKRKAKVFNNGWDNEKHDYLIQVGEVLDDRYRVEQIMGKGSFGQVVKATDLTDNSPCAVKIIKNKAAFFKQAQVEIQLLQMLNRADPEDQFSIVRYFRNFTYRNHLCLVFELLASDLYELIRRTHHKGVSLRLVRKFSIQILRAVDFLAKNKIIHCDLKPENILLEDHKRSAIKVVDFGSSCTVGKTVYHYIQSRFYRSPEVMLGRKYDEKIDMWSVGCIMVELLMGKPLFSGSNEVDQMAKIVEVCDIPPASFILGSPNGKKFFKFSQQKCTSVKDRSKEYQEPGSRLLSDILLLPSGGPRKSLATGGDHQQTQEQLHEFMDLVYKLLEYDPAKRLSAADAMKHPFFKYCCTTLTSTLTHSHPPRFSLTTALYACMVFKNNGTGWVVLSIHAQCFCLFLTHKHAQTCTSVSLLRKQFVVSKQASILCTQAHS
eukprot:m.134881 g.134881  ORF g.134881 m.134881 type:complete len:495 (+) comp13966_c0_seq3:609-2093(+)